MIRRFTAFYIPVLEVMSSIEPKEIETKVSMREVDLRETEKSKIACARRHFASLSDSTVKYDVINSYEELFNLVNSNS